MLTRLVNTITVTSHVSTVRVSSALFQHSVFSPTSCLQDCRVDMCSVFHSTFHFYEYRYGELLLLYCACSRLRAAVLPELALQISELDTFGELIATMTIAIVAKTLLRSYGSHTASLAGLPSNSTPADAVELVYYQHHA